VSKGAPVFMKILLALIALSAIIAISAEPVSTLMQAYRSTAPTLSRTSDEKLI
jgi:hypothetical protein